LKELYGETSPDYLDLRYCGGELFALKWQPPKNQRFLVLLGQLDDSSTEKSIVDPNRLDPRGSTSIDFYAPSPDGRLVAVSLSSGGSEEGVVHVYEVESGRELSDFVPRVNYPTGGGSVAWNGEGSGFYYTRYPRTGERPIEDLNFYQQVYFHKLGTPTVKDIYVIGREFPRIAEIRLSTTEDGRYLIATVANGDGGEFSHYLMNPDGEWTQVTKFSDQITLAALGLDNSLYLLSRKDTPRGKILKLSLGSPYLEQAKTIIEQSESNIEGFEPTAKRLFVAEVDGGPSKIKVYDLDGRSEKSVPLEPVSDVGQIVRIHGDDILFRSESYVTPPAWYQYVTAREEASKTRLYVTSPADFSDCEVVREFATSKDRTKVPLNIIRRKGTKLDGKNPVLLTGYGGYSISVKPYFRIRRRIWLDQGGVIAVANLRGGGEYGEEWHKGGNLTRKQNVFDDFAACAQHLIERGYTSPGLLAIEGGSNGGLLMGAALTQHPELFRAVVSHVGIYDMLRVELDPNGAFNVTEFGTIKDLDQFKALYAYSPFHRVVDGTSYPAVLLPAGENDGRVNPAQTRKMTARLQQATVSGRAVLLRSSSSSGHGVDTALDEQIAIDTDVFAFLFEQLGLINNPPAQ
jgi:prolyl oligopeptidase